MPLSRVDVGLAREERLPATLLLLLLVALCLAGGASREDVIAQSVIRTFAIALMIVQILFGRLPEFGRYKVCAVLLLSMMAVALLQLVPLPPAIWTALPGRAIISASPLGAEGWRPLNLVPDAGWNSFFSLLVPLCTLVLLSCLKTKTVDRLQYLLVGAAIFSSLIALLQAAGSMPDNPLINGNTTDFGGIFANRNHQALFLAIGIVISWFLGFRHGGHWRDRRLWLAVGVILLLSISILVTGSRTGAILGVLAIVIGPLGARPKPQRRGRPTVSHHIIWPAISLAIVCGVLVLSAYFGRAASLDRATTIGVESDFRLRALPTVWQISKTYFPFGAGLGSFDAVFRIAEPFALLEPTYFNHAHNDFLETVIETGMFGPVIFLCAAGWVVRRTIATFLRSGSSARVGRLGSFIFVLVVVASVSDYPARTPIVMTIVMIAGCWLSKTESDSREHLSSDALPANRNYL
jgi:O-antigen ligase